MASAKIRVSAKVTGAWEQEYQVSELELPSNPKRKRPPSSSCFADSLLLSSTCRGNTSWHLPKSFHNVWQRFREKETARERGTSCRRRSCSSCLTDSFGPTERRHVDKPARRCRCSRPSTLPLPRRYARYTPSKIARVPQGSVLEFRERTARIERLLPRALDLVQRQSRTGTIRRHQWFHRCKTCPSSSPLVKSPPRDS